MANFNIENINKDYRKTAPMECSYWLFECLPEEVQKQMKKDYAAAGGYPKHKWYKWCMDHIEVSYKPDKIALDKTEELIARAEVLESTLSSNEEIEIENYDGDICISRYSEERQGAEEIEKFCTEEEIDLQKLKNLCDERHWPYVL